MIYKNDSYDAVLAMEQHHIGGEDDSEEYIRCPICGDIPDAVYKDGMGDIVGCDCCIRKIYL